MPTPCRLGLQRPDSFGEAFRLKGEVDPALADLDRWDSWKRRAAGQARQSGLEVRAQVPSAAAAIISHGRSSPTWEMIAPS